MIPWLLLCWCDTGEIAKPHLIDKYTQIALRKSVLSQILYVILVNSSSGTKGTLEVIMTLWLFIQDLWCRPLSEVVRLNFKKIMLLSLFGQQGQAILESSTP